MQRGNKIELIQNTSNPFWTIMYNGLTYLEDVPTDELSYWMEFILRNQE